MSSSPFATQPPTGFGPGSQPGTDEEGLAYLPLPSGMRTFEAHLPEVEDKDRFAPAFLVLEEVIAALEAWTPGACLPISLSHLDPANLALVDEAMGEGEVAVMVAGLGDMRAIEIQEATFAGVWRLRGGAGTERIEVAAFPRGALVRAFGAATGIDLSGLDAPAPGIFNAPALLVEIEDRSRTRAAGDPPHVINLSLLPHTPEDLAMLDARLGTGATTVLSRGYGNCRIDATATRNVWRVRFYNSQDMLILDTIEVSDVPEVACAAREDITDSAERLTEVLAAMR
ncbi:hydrogenase expression/formation protein [Xanthobacter dioxanivorans]|uniref:Hydrogenase expression/formation protein n=1 Tax=Xanthobacter dioxanivorans TaxID=2528964 RepID=A0A974SIX9_9HYPH|nr:hydrogenase expression/formation protein [Xanthobacter dioxanivorans]QRG07841.1 hydrogenase expression/formation protein [Xanthobacter dioxanivorans]